MKINEMCLDGFYVSKKSVEFGKEDNRQTYNCLKILVGDDVLLVKIPKDKENEFDDLKPCSPLKIMVDIDLERESDDFSKYTARFSLNSVIPFNIKNK